MKIEHFFLLLFIPFILGSCSGPRLNGYFGNGIRQTDSGYYSPESYRFKRNGQFSIYEGSSGIYPYQGPVGSYGRGKYRIKDEFIYFSFEEVDSVLWKIEMTITPFDTTENEYNIYKFSENFHYKFTIYDDRECSKYSHFKGRLKNPVKLVPKSIGEFTIQSRNGQKFHIKNEGSAKIEFSIPKISSFYPAKTTMRYPFKKLGKRSFRLDERTYYKPNLYRNSNLFTRIKQWYFTRQMEKNYDYY